MSLALSRHFIQMIIYQNSKTVNSDSNSAAIAQQGQMKGLLATITVSIVLFCFSEKRMGFMSAFGSKQKQILFVVVYCCIHSLEVPIPKHYLLVEL